MVADQSAIYSCLHLITILYTSFKTKLTMLITGFSLRTGAAGEYCKGGLLWKGKAQSGNKQNLAREFCVVARDFSNLRCLMNTL